MVGLIFRESGNRWINNFESFKEPIATVVNMDWAIPRWKATPFLDHGFGVDKMESSMKPLDDP